MASEPPVVAILDDRSVNVTLAPASSWGFSGINQEYNKTTTSSGTAGSTLTLDFEGTAIEVFGTLGYGTSATQSYSVDGRSIQNFTAPTQSTPQLHHSLYSLANLAAGPHKLVITQLSNHVPYDAGNLYVDYFLVTSPPLPPANENAYYDDADGFVDYQGDWVENQGSAQAFGQTLHTALQANATATFNFTGTGVNVYGTLAQSVTDQNYATFAMDGELGVAPDWHDSNPPWDDGVLANHPMYSISLNPGQHSLVIKALLPSALALDYFTVLGGKSNTQFNVTDVSTVSVSSTISSFSSSSSTSTASSSSSSAGLESSSASSAVVSTSSHTKVGAVAGGVIAGICVLVALALGLILLRRRRRRQREEFVANSVAPFDPSLMMQSAGGQPLYSARQYPGSHPRPSESSWGNGLADPSSSTYHSNYQSREQSGHPYYQNAAVPFPLSPQRHPSQSRVPIPPVPPLDTPILHITTSGSLARPQAPRSAASYDSSPAQSVSSQHGLLAGAAGFPTRSRNDSGSTLYGRPRNGSFGSSSLLTQNRDGNDDDPFTPLTPRPSRRRKDSRGSLRSVGSSGVPPRARTRSGPRQAQDSGLRYVPSEVPSVVTEEIPPEYTED